MRNNPGIQSRSKNTSGSRDPGIVTPSLYPAKSPGTRPNVPNPKGRNTYTFYKPVRRDTQHKRKPALLTHFQLTNKQKHTYDNYNKLLTKLNEKLKQQKLKILQADKGPGLILVQNNTLTQLYKKYFSAEQSDTNKYMKALHDLKVILYMIMEPRKMNSTDDRPPTVYFKVKTHKTTFRTSTTEHEEIYTYKNGAQELLPISRAIVNHKNSITSSSCDMLRTLIKPIIEQSKYLTADIFETIHQICEHGLPDTIHTGDIEAFYLNIPHDLILDAFKHYHPLLRTERQLLRRLLNFNFATDGRHYYNFGNTGIPMGLPIAPELARMCTAYLLKDYNPPPGQSLTIYFDDIAASYPLDNIPLEPYTVKSTDAKQTQD